MPQLYDLSANTPSARNNAYAIAQLNRLKAAQAGQDYRSQNQADQVLPGIIQALGDQAGQQVSPSMPTPAATPPMPMPSPQGPPQGGGGPMPQVPQMPASSLMPQSPYGGPMGTPPAPPGAGPNVSFMPGAGPPQGGGQPPQAPPQMLSQPQGGGQAPVQSAKPPGGYELQDVVRIIKSQYPNISGGALRNVLTTLNPLILTPQAKMQLEYLKMMNNQFNKDRDFNLKEDKFDFSKSTKPTDQLAKLMQAAAPYIQSGADLPPELAQAISKITAQMGVSGGGSGPGAGGAAPSGQPGKTGTGFNVKQAQEAAKKDADAIEQVVNNAPKLKNLDRQLEQFEKLNDSGAFNTGFAGETRAKGQQALAYANRAGLPIGGDSNKAAAQVATNMQKLSAGIVSDWAQVNAVPGMRATVFASQLLKQSKPGVDQEPQTNDNIVHSVRAGLAEQRLWADYNKKYINDRAKVNDALDNAGEQFPLYTESFTKDGMQIVTYKPENLAKQKEYVDHAMKMGQEETPGESDGAVAAPKAGAVEDGYKFKGGNPADPNSWEKVR